MVPNESSGGSEHSTILITQHGWPSAYLVDCGTFELRQKGPGSRARGGQITPVAMARIVWLALWWSGSALATAAAPGEEWITMIHWDGGAQLRVKVSAPLPPGHELWASTKGAVAGRDPGFKSTIEEGESGAIWNFDLFWGGTCMEGQPCHYERHFRLAVHRQGKVRCQTEFSTADLVSPHQFEFELIETGEGCRLQKAERK